eukprot:1267307-Prymnesium_polylepis.1
MGMAGAAVAFAVLLLLAGVGIGACLMVSWRSDDGKGERGQRLQKRIDHRGWIDNDDWSEAWEVRV